MAFRIPGVWGPNPNPQAKPKITRDLETTVRGLYVAGDLGGSPVIRTAVNQGVAVARRVRDRLRTSAPRAGVFDLIIVGAGASGLAAGLEAKKLGLDAVLLEKREWAATIQDFAKGKEIFAEPKTLANESDLWIDDDTPKEDLLARWQRTLDEADLDLREDEEVIDVFGEGGEFEVKTRTGVYRGRTVLLSIGTRGNPRRLGAHGEELPKVHYKLADPAVYEDRKILVVGGGDSALETALALCLRNEVAISYRAGAFARAKPKNIERVEAALARGELTVHWNTTVRYIDEDKVCVSRPDGQEDCFPNDDVFVQIGADLPTKFLRKVGIEFEGDRNLGWWGRVAIAFAVAFLYYTVAKRRGENIWYTFGLGDAFRSVIDWMNDDHFLIAGRYGKFGGTAFFASLAYSLVILGFGIQAMRRWWSSKVQRWRFASLIFFQCFFFFVLPEIIVRNSSWIPVGVREHFSQTYGLIYAWPLSIYAIIGAPGEWIVWGLVLTFVLIPIYVRFFGKAFCTWICGCGGLAETLGDRWRHLAPKGKLAHRLQRMNWAVLAFATLVTLTWALTRLTSWDGVLVSDIGHEPVVDAGGLFKSYSVAVDWLMVGVIPISLYPVFGGKIWCRYWCPLAKYMEVLSRWFGRLKIRSNARCISCNECSRYCQVGIDVMQFARRKEAFDNTNTQCIQCGICIAVCPVDVLSFTRDASTPVSMKYDG